MAAASDIDFPGFIQKNLSFGLRSAFSRSLLNPPVSSLPAASSGGGRTLYRLVHEETFYGGESLVATTTDIELARLELHKSVHAKYLDVVKKHRFAPILKHLSLSAVWDDEAWFGQKQVSSFRIATKHANINSKAFSVDINALKSYAGEILGDMSETKVSVARLLDEFWWRRQARKRLREIREALWLHLYPLKLKAGVSIDAHRASRAQDQATDIWAGKRVIYHKESGLKFAIDTSAESRKKRYSELLCRTSGISKRAAEAGLTAFFITATAPSNMHATTTKNGKRVENENWDGTLPADAHSFLLKAWANTRSSATFRRIKREIGHIDFVRATEPHGDGTPHIHVLVFLRLNDKEALENVLRRCFKCRKCDGEARFKHGIKVEMKKDAGHIVSYLAKYIAKSAGSDVEKPDADVLAWRRAHGGIRSFALSRSGATVWKRARAKHLDHTQDEDLKLVIDAAKQNDAFEFDKLSVGFSLFYEEAENGYGETVSRVAGVYNRRTSEITFFHSKCVIATKAEAALIDCVHIVKSDRSRGVSQE